MRRRIRRRCAVLGLDGVSYELLLRLSGNGMMPGTARLLARGRLQRMRATLPETSAVSWTSFMTGQNAGRHGVFGFIDLEEQNYRLRFPNALDLKVPTIFERLGRVGGQAVVINLPGTYPASAAFPGVLVSGFVALELEKAVSRPALLPFLRRIGYCIDVDATRAKHKNAEFLSSLHYSLLVRRQLLHKLWQEEDWNLFLFTVTETDRLQHFFYDAIADDQHPRHDQVADFFYLLDEVVAEIADLAGQEDCPLFMLSDHGFYPLKAEVNLNPLLRCGGFGAAVMDDGFASIRPAPGARAFALDPSRVYVHERGRYPDGGVDPHDSAALKEDLKAFFMDLDIDGQAVIRQVFDRNDLYQGQETRHAADLILLSQPGFDLKGGLSREAVHERGSFCGMHGYDNAFFFSSQGQADQARITDGHKAPELSIEQAALPILKELELQDYG